MSKSSGFMGFLQSILGQSEEPETSGLDSAEEKEEILEHKSSTVEETFVESAVYVQIEATLRQLWKMWGGNELPPALSLTEGLDESRIKLDYQQLKRESERIAALLEKDAKLRLREIEQAQVKELDGVAAQCSVYLSWDRMIAWLFVFPPVGQGGGNLMERVGKALQERKVVNGINAEAMVRIAQTPPYFQLIPIAVGTPAIQGVNGSVTPLFEKTLPREVKIDETGRADYKYTNYVRQVMKDDTICEITLPVPGTAGLRVDGTVEEPKPVKPAKVPKGVNTVVTEDGLRLVATMDGHLEFTNQCFQVRPVLVVKGDVDYEFGNIQFTGDVHIQGDVRENFSVSATGSVSIDGLVEAATVEAGTDVLITRGVVGDNRALIRSGGCVRVKYLENCVVYAKDGVYADCIMNSQIFSDSVIEVCTGRGSVIGGAMTAAQTIRAKMIGAESGRRTDLTLGTYPYVQNELINIEEDIEANRMERDELNRTLAHLELQQGLEGSSAKLAKARMRRSVLDIKEKQLEGRRAKLEEVTLPDVTRCKLEADAIYVGTSLTVHDAVWKAPKTLIHCRILYDPEEHILKEYH